MSSQVPRLKVLTVRAIFRPYWEDVTYLDLPYLVALNPLLKDSLAFANRRRAQQYGVYVILKDTMRKIQQDAMSAKNVFANRIETVVFGNLEYNSRNDSFHLTKKDGRRIPSLNLASGIRSWGILQRLLAAGYLTPQSLLVIDEPETNLHPEWQVSMAQLLVELVDAGIPVLVNTHSNYMVDALKYFSDNKKLEAVTRFYWVEPEGDGSGSVTKNVTDDLEPIFHAFNRPFLRTMF